MGLTYFSPKFHFCPLFQSEKTFAFLMFSGGMKMEHWLKWLNYESGGFGDF